MFTLEMVNQAIRMASELDESKATNDPTAYTAPGHDLAWHQLDGVSNRWKFCGNYMEIFGVLVVQWVDDSGLQEFYATFAPGALDIPQLVHFIRQPIGSDGPGVAS